MSSLHLEQLLEEKLPFHSLLTERFCFAATLLFDSGAPPTSCLHLGVRCHSYSWKNPFWRINQQQNKRYQQRWQKNSHLLSVLKYKYRYFCKEKKNSNIQYIWKYSNRIWRVSKVSFFFFLQLVKLLICLTSCAKGKHSGIFNSIVFFPSYYSCTANCYQQYFWLLSHFYTYNNNKQWCFLLSLRIYFSVLKMYWTVTLKQSASEILFLH